MHVDGSANARFYMVHYGNGICRSECSQLVDVLNIHGLNNLSGRESETIEQIHASSRMDGDALKLKIL